MNIVYKPLFQSFLFGLGTFHLLSDGVAAPGGMTEDDLPGYSYGAALRANPELVKQWFLSEPSRLRTAGMKTHDKLSQKVDSKDWENLLYTIDREWVLKKFTQQFEKPEYPRSLSWLYGMPADTDWDATIHSNTQLKNAFDGLVSNFGELEGPMRAVLAQELIIATQYEIHPLFEEETIEVRSNQLDGINAILTGDPEKNPLVERENDARFFNWGERLMRWEPEEIKTLEFCNDFSKVAECVRRLNLWDIDDEDKSIIVLKLARSKAPVEVAEILNNLFSDNLDDESKIRIVEGIGNSNNPKLVIKLATPMLSDDMGGAVKADIIEGLGFSKDPALVIELLDNPLFHSLDRKYKARMVFHLGFSKDPELVVDLAEKMFAESMNDECIDLLVEALSESRIPEHFVEVAESLFSDEMSGIEKAKVFHKLGRSRIVELAGSLFSDDMGGKYKARIVKDLQNKKPKYRKRVVQLAQNLFSDDMDGQCKALLVQVLSHSEDPEEVAQAAQLLLPAFESDAQKVEIVHALRHSKNPEKVAKSAISKFTDTMTDEDKANIIHAELNNSDA